MVLLGEYLGFNTNYIIFTNVEIFPKFFFFLPFRKKNFLKKNNELDKIF